MEHAVVVIGKGGDAVLPQSQQPQQHNGTTNGKAGLSGASQVSNNLSELSSFEAHHEDAEGRKLRSTKKAKQARQRQQQQKQQQQQQQTQQRRHHHLTQTRDDEANPRKGGVAGSSGGGGTLLTHIPDEQVQVNLAMSDLMAYLQVVANNSNNLPLTKRDDPDTTTSAVMLTSEDYARKAAAFVPADVRVIGGTFTRYGRVWDLPTSEEYNAQDGAQEPGRSYGAACSNAMLKVLYDSAANDNHKDHEGGATGGNADATLFDDDEEEDDEGDASAFGNSLKSGFSLDAGSAHLTSISWADLLKKMKAEIKDIEYAQIPKLTTSRKLDLSKDFSLVPENFDPIKGKKRSLLIGCNYSNDPDAELKASHDDIRSMKDYIVNVHGFPETKGLMTILLDDDEHAYPTFMNIVDAFKRLSEESQPGDAVFIQFSGHGGRVLDAPSSDTASSYDEVICPCDYKMAGLIRDTLIFKTLLAPMRFGVTVTIIIDCCDTGMVLELPYAWRTNNEKRDIVAKMTTNEDFSFVRFLKVVKTLYETSTFTQLGKTVGSALKPGNSMLDSKDEAEMDKNGQTRHRSKRDRIKPVHDTFFDAITDVCKPAADNCDNIQTLTDELAKRDGAPKQSLLEQVMNCTLLSHHPEQEDYYTDDEDTYKTRTEEDTDDATESFESLTDEDEDYNNKRQKSGKRRQKAAAR